MFHSSPIKGTALEEIEQSQQNRAARLYHPMLSPGKMVTGREKARHTAEEIRSLHRQTRLALGREKIADKEEYKKQMEELRVQAEELELDPDLLVEEERQVLEQEMNQDLYEAQLEDFLVDEELELEQQLRDLQLEEKEKKS